MRRRRIRFNSYRRKNPILKLMRFIIFVAILIVIFYYTSPYFMPYLINYLPDLKNIHLPDFKFEVQ